MMKNILYIISLSILTACSSVNNSKARKKLGYGRIEEFRATPNQTYHPLMHKPSAEEVDADFEEGIYQMLLNMTVEQRIEFSKVFILTEPDIQSIDSLVRK